MAAQEYYNSFNAPSQNSQHHDPPPQYQPLAPQQPGGYQQHPNQYQDQNQYGWTPDRKQHPLPPPAIALNHEQQQYRPSPVPYYAQGSPSEQQQQYLPDQPPRPPRPQTSQVQSQSYLTAPSPLRPHRSHSEPPPPQEEYHRRDRSRDQKRYKRHSRYRSSSRSSSRERGYDRDERDYREERHHHHRHQSPSQRSGSISNAQKARSGGSGKSTFLGAGAGAIIGDLIFPGLGTVSGALLGGIGANEASKKRRNASTGGRHPRRTHEDDR